MTLGGAKNWIARMVGGSVDADASVAATVACAPEGQRIYAIGDVHGRIDLLDRLLLTIRAECVGLAPDSVEIVLLGDLIDRGPGSAEVVARAMEGLSWAQLTVLAGNHEAMLGEALAGDRQAMAAWVKHGGAATLTSFGVDPQQVDQADYGELVELAREAIPQSVRRWLSRLPLYVQRGDYLLVHAGIRPGVALEDQRAADMQWIRGRFLEDDRDHGMVVVHGHSVRENIDARANRIGIDTGAWSSGRLTAIALEGSDRRFLEAADTRPLLREVVTA